MAGVDRPGRFKAFIVENTLDYKDSGAVQFVAKCFISQYFDAASGEWVDFSETSMEQMAYLNLVKKDGDLNQRNIESLKEALGWDGTSFDGLLADFSKICVQITVESEMYQDKQRFSVAWINPENYEGQALAPITPEKLQTLNAKFGGKLKMLNGTKKAPAAPPASKPLPPAPPVPAEPVAAETAAPAASTTPKGPMPRPGRKPY